MTGEAKFITFFITTILLVAGTSFVPKDALYPICVGWGIWVSTLLREIEK